MICLLVRAERQSTWRKLSKEGSTPDQVIDWRLSRSITFLSMIIGLLAVQVLS